MSVETQQQKRSEEAKIEALREAAAAGFEAIDLGKFQEVLADEIGATINAIGKRATRRLRRTAR